MRVWKKWAGAFLALTLTAGALSGCGGEPGKASSAASGASSAVSQASSEVTSSEAESSQAASSEAGTGNKSTFDYGAGLTEDGMFEGVTALDYVILPDYKSIEVPAELREVSEEEIQTQVDNLLDSFATTEQNKERAVVDGDTVNIDYVGSVDGVEFSGGNTGGNGTTVTIGVTSYIDDFLEQLIGHKPGETFDVNVTFPEPYENNEELSGKDAVFVTTINYIEEKVTPELTDSFAAEHWKNTKGWSTAEEVREGVRAQLENSAVSNHVWDKILEGAQVSEVPESMVEYYRQGMMNYYTIQMRQYGVEPTEEDKEKAAADAQEDLEKSAKESLVLQALCEDMGFQLTEESMDAYLKYSLNMEDYTDLAEFYGQPYLKMVSREALLKQELGGWE